MSTHEVETVLRQGEIITDYPDDKPYPSCVVLDFVSERAIHVVAARDPRTRACYVVTVYPPDPDLWDTDFRRRR